MTLVEKVARSLCMAACDAHREQVDRSACPYCKDLPDCTLHETFNHEARAAIAAVRRSDRGK